MSTPPGVRELWKAYPLRPPLMAKATPTSTPASSGLPIDTATPTSTPTFAPIPTPTATPAPVVMQPGVHLTVPAAATFAGLVVILAFLTALLGHRIEWPAAITAALEIMGVLAVAAAITAALAAQGWL